MIELAPNNKRGLGLRSPLMAGSGAVGLGDNWPPGMDAGHFGALVTAAISWHSQRGPGQPRVAEIPGGFLLANGDQNPGFRRVMEGPGLDWRGLAVPVIVAMAAADPGEWTRLAEHLDEVPGVAGLELQLAEDASGAEVRAGVSAVRRTTTLPLLVKLPAVRAAALAPTAASGGADALVVGTAPCGAYSAGEGMWIESPVGGPVAFPFTLLALRRVVDLALGLPVVAAGGIQGLGDAARCLELGAVAIQIRSLLWTDPAAALRLATGLRDLTSLEP